MSPSAAKSNADRQRAYRQRARVALKAITPPPGYERFAALVAGAWYAIDVVVDAHPQDKRLAVKNLILAIEDATQ